jgi:hypothetical protein
MAITLNGVKYWQPECHCKHGGHIWYLRPMPQVINVPIEKILSKMGTSGNPPTPEHKVKGVRDE